MFIIGMFLVVFGLPPAIATARNLYLVSNNPDLYYFANGMTEETATVAAIFYWLLVIAGIVLMICSWMKRKNKATLASIVNAETQNYCNTCNINVSNQCSNCPVCGKLLKEKNKGD